MSYVGSNVLFIMYSIMRFKGFVKKIYYHVMDSDDDDRNHGKACDDNGNNCFFQRSLYALSGKLQF